MKKILITLFLVFPLTFSSALSFATDGGKWWGYGTIDKADHGSNGKGHEKGKGKGHHKDGGGSHPGKGLGHGKHHVTSVPEIDAAGAALAIALMGGMVSIARERRRKLASS